MVRKNHAWTRSQKLTRPSPSRVHMIVHCIKHKSMNDTAVLNSRTNTPPGAPAYAERPLGLVSSLSSYHTRLQHVSSNSYGHTNKSSTAAAAAADCCSCSTQRYGGEEGYGSEFEKCVPRAPYPCNHRCCCILSPANNK